MNFLKTSFYNFYCIPAKVIILKMKYLNFRNKLGKKFRSFSLELRGYLLPNIKNYLIMPLNGINSFFLPVPWNNITTWFRQGMLHKNDNEIILDPHQFLMKHRTNSKCTPNEALLKITSPQIIKFINYH